MKVFFILQYGTTSYMDAKALRPIILSLFLLKTLEKLVASYIREGLSLDSHRNHHVCQLRKFVKPQT